MAETRDLTKRHFDDLIGAYLAYCHNVKAPETYKKWAAVSMIAGALQRKVWYTTGKIWWYPNMYIFLIGERSTRKSSSSKIAVGLLRELENFDVSTAQVNTASLMRDIAEAGKLNSFEHFGKTYRFSPMYIYASEAAMVLGAMYIKGSPIDYLVDVYNCNDESHLEKPQAVRSTIAWGKQAVYNPVVNILACSTPAWLTGKLITREDVHGGFGSRITFVVHEGEYDDNDDVHVEDTVDDEVLRRKLIEDLRSIHSLVGGFASTDGWRTAMAVYNRKHKDWINEHKFQDRILAACLARKTDAAMQKMSMLLAINEGNTLVLEERHAHAAWEMLTDLEKTMPYALGDLGSNLEVKPAQDILAYLREKKATTITYQTLCRIFAKVHTAKRIREGLSNLELQGVLALDRVSSRLPNLTFTVVNVDAQNQKQR